MNIAFLRSELVTQGTDICARGPSPSGQVKASSLCETERLPFSKQDDLWHLFICEACKITVSHNGK